jgi:diguanylate cyclase (GGDEF)-like protein/PAS domain S-box-containing protein
MQQSRPATWDRKVKLVRPHLFVAVALTIVALCGLNPVLQNGLTDIGFRLTSRSASGNVVVVAIDSASIDTVGSWPWPRRVHGDLIAKLQAAGAADVVFDVDLSSPSNAVDDAALAAALKTAGGSVILPRFRQAAAGAMSSHNNRPLPEFEDNSWLAVVNVSVERDGRVRRYPFGERLDGEFVPSMGAMLAGRNAPLSPPFLIDFGIYADSIPVVSYADVLQGIPQAMAILKGRKVIVGGTALELGDRFSVPNGAVIPGPLLQALAAESIIQHRVLYQTPAWLGAANLAVLALMMVLTWRRYAAARRAALLIMAGIMIEAIAILVQMKWPVVFETATLELAIGFYILAIGLDELDLRGVIGRIAERRFHQIAMSLGDGLVCTDSNFRITVWNPAAEAIFGYSARDLIGQPFTLIWSDGGHGPRIPDALRMDCDQMVQLEGRRKSGETFPLEASFSSWEGSSGPQYGAVLRDISERRREEERIRYLAEYDALTGLANQNALASLVNTAIASAKSRQSEVGLLLISIDSFQQVNDTMGHADGDLLLQAVATHLLSILDDGQTLARMSGDEFAVHLHGRDIRRVMTTLSARLSSSMLAPLLVGTRRHSIRSSIAGACSPGDGETAEELIGNAHLALNRAKTRRAYVKFERSIREDVIAAHTLEMELVRAYEKGEFELFFQPQVHLEDDSLVGAEALIRWRHPTRGLVSPADFMPIVNASALSDKVAAWVLHSACVQARAWQIAGNNIRIGVNLSPSQFQTMDLAEAVMDVLRKTGLSPELLELEVTEDILLDDEQRALAVFRNIQIIGVRLVFDDFGTGFGSLSYLKKFPLDGLKIDRSFVSDIRSDDAAIVSSTIGLAKKLGLSVIAEGIEDRATAELLLELGCLEGQGYFFGKPMSALEFNRRFLEQRPPEEMSRSPARETLQTSAN